MPPGTIPTKDPWRGTVMARVGRLDPLIPLSYLAALVVFCLHGFDGKLSRDLAFYAYAGQAFAEGVPPYKGVFNQAGPLAHMLPALGVWLARLGRFDELLGMRVVFMLFAAACVSAAYVVARDAFRSRAAGIAAAAAMISFSGFVELASNGPREKTPMVLLMLLSVWAANRQRWFLAGVFVSLSTLVLQVAFFVAAPVVVATAVVTTRGRARAMAVARFLAGGTAPVAVAVVYFAAMGALGPAVDGFVLVNLKYTRAHQLDFAEIPRAVVRGFGASTWFVVAGLIAPWALLLVNLARRGKDPAQVGIVTGLAFGALGGALWIVEDFDNWPDAFPLLPIAAIGVGGVVAAAVSRVPHRLGLALTLLVSLTAFGLGLGYSVTDRNHELDRQRASVARMTRILGPDVSVLSIQAPAPLVLTGKRNPSRYQLFSSGLGAYVRDHWPGGLRGYESWILHEQPTLVAIGRPSVKRWAAALGADYERVGCAPGWQWYASRTVDDETMAALRSAGRGPC